MMRRIKKCPGYWVTLGGTVVSPLGKEVKQRAGKVFICGSWVEVKLLNQPRKVKARFSVLEKQLVLHYKGSNSSGRLFFLATFGRSISPSSWYRLRSSLSAVTKPLSGGEDT